MATQPRKAFVKCWLTDKSVIAGTIVNQLDDYLERIDTKRGHLSFAFEDGRDIVVEVSKIEAFYVGKDDPWAPKPQVELFAKAGG